MHCRFFTFVSCKVVWSYFVVDPVKRKSRSLKYSVYFTSNETANVEYRSEGSVKKIDFDLLPSKQISLKVNNGGI